jgi:hypothetical protein
MIEVQYVHPFESYTKQQQWLAILKTCSREFEIVASLGNGLGPVTLGSGVALEAALQLAKLAASELRISSIYVVGSRFH